jgi:Leucine-rich repeat (LRR) protein
MERRNGWRVQAIRSDGDKPLTFAVQTGSGAIGVLQITGFTNNPPGLKLRYKLVVRTEPPTLADAVKGILTYGGFVKTNSAGRIFRVSMVYDYDEQGNRLECNDNADQFAEWLLGFPDLEELWLKEHQITDRTMRFAGRLHELKSLFMWDAKLLTDEGVSKLADLKQLETLHIGKSRIGDRSLAVLAGLPKLQSLTLQENHFTDQGLRSIAGMTQLTNLWVGNGSVITDQGLPSLSGLTNLQQLELQDCPITDAGLRHLRDLKKLRRLIINGTETTEEGRAQLKAAIPGLEIQPTP